MKKVLGTILIVSTLMLSASILKVFFRRLETGLPATGICALLQREVNARVITRNILHN